VSRTGARQVLIYGDSVRDPAIRHEVPVAIGDRILFAESGGRRTVVTTELERAKLRQIPGLEVHTLEEFGLYELLGSDLAGGDAIEETFVRAVVQLGITAAVVPADFALGFAERLRARGVSVTPDRAYFAARRRMKNERELAGIRRAQRAAETAMAAAADLLRNPRGRNLTSERVKSVISRTLADHGCRSDTFIVASGAQAALGHDRGSGPIRPGEPIVIDIGPREMESGCFADMTRTFVLGDPPDELVDWQRMVLAALQQAVAGCQVAAQTHELYHATCNLFEDAGFATRRTAVPSLPLSEGFTHALGHGVGLELHEPPFLGMSHDTLSAGDVVAVEPGLYRKGFGGVRLEDLVLITEGGPENLTSYPYDLKP